MATLACKMHAEVNTATEGLTRRGREMKRVLERCERSGLSLAEFARRERMSANTLAWWRHRLRRTGVTGRKRAAERSAGFRELVLDAPSSAGAIAEVVLRSGRILRVPLAGVDAEVVRVLVRALEEPC